MEDGLCYDTHASFDGRPPYKVFTLGILGFDDSFIPRQRILLPVNHDT